MNPTDAPEGIDPADQPDPTPVPEEQRARVAPEIDQAQSREEVLALAVGAASTCWSDPGRAGTFDSTEASKIVDAAVARIAELDKIAERERRAEERRKAREAKAAESKGGE